MSGNRDEDMLQMGADLGIYVIASLFAETGLKLTPRGFQAMADFSAADIERICGLPAEDFALKVQPMVDEIKRMIREAER